MTVHHPLRTLLIPLAALVLLAATTAGARENDRRRGSAEAEVAELMYCYARGTDAIGDATTNFDPLATGLGIYRECFVEDAVFRAWFPHQPFDAQAFPDFDATPPTSTVHGVQGWAEFVDGVFRGNGYDFTQHVISNVDVDVKGRHATLTAYLNASHVISGDAIGGASRCVAVANGTYSLTATKLGGRWRATGLDLTLITFNPVFETDTGCTPP